MDEKVYNLNVKSSVKVLEDVRDFISVTAEDLGFDEHSAFEIEISVYEACANVIEHAYCNDPEGIIWIKIVGDSTKAVITITDNGLRFPPNIDRTVDITKFIETRQDGGLGIYIIEACMDEIKYCRENETNVLEMVKYRQS
ncbi:MAG: ATP-binding protein, partial [Candidatus Coatesbacteria bacterium]